MTKIAEIPISEHPKFHPRDDQCSICNQTYLRRSPGGKYCITCREKAGLLYNKKWYEEHRKKHRDRSYETIRCRVPEQYADMEGVYLLAKSVIVSAIKEALFLRKFGDCGEVGDKLIQESARKFILHNNSGFAEYCGICGLNEDKIRRYVEEKIALGSKKGVA